VLNPSKKKVNLMNEQPKNWQPGDRQEDMPARKSNGSEMQEWFASLEPALEFVLKNQEPLKATRFLDKLVGRLREAGVKVPQVVSTPYINTIPVEQQKPYPGDWKTEVRIKSFIRWNAMAMVVNANAKHDGLGGHISTFASSATLYEVAFNHFFRGRHDDFAGDIVYFQGHASPGVYARAFLERRLDERHLQNFRQELAEGGGLSSYPHPYLMPDFWQFPTVSMGLGPIMSSIRRGSTAT
jgi:pyruvate dehydrogenase E1 component